MQSQHRYSIEDDDNVKLPLAHIKKMQNTAEGETLAINKTVSSIKAIIGRRESDVSVRKV